DPLFPMMIHGQVLCVVVSDSLIGRPFVGMDLSGVVMDVLIDERMQSLSATILNDGESYFPIALGGSDHNGFTLAAPASNATALPANEGFVNFNNSAELLGTLVLHR